MKIKIHPLLKNKYILASIAFIILVGFVDNNNLIRSFKTQRSIRELEKTKEYYLKEIQHTKIIWEDLTNNPASFEKFARETYFLKKPDEEIILIEMK